MHAINRRKALTVVASVPAVAALAAIPAVANAGEDAELRKLWEKLKAERAECDRLSKIHTQRQLGGHWRDGRSRGRQVVRERDPATLQNLRRRARPLSRRCARGFRLFDLEEDLIETGCNGYEQVAESLIKAIRDYLARQVQA